MDANIKHFTNKKDISYVFLDVPHYATNFDIEFGNLLTCYKMTTKLDIVDVIKLPHPNYEIIGLAKDVIEDVAREIVDDMYICCPPEYLYKDYGNEDDIDDLNCFSSALPSLYSLVQSLGLTNPIILKIIK